MASWAIDPPWMLTRSWLDGRDNAMEAQPAMSAYYSAALLGVEQKKDEPIDVWGNPKVPFLESLHRTKAGWSTVAHESQTQYSSLLGMRLQGLCRNCTLTFPIETMYTNLTCRNAVHQIDHKKTMDYIGQPYTGWMPSIRASPFLGAAQYFEANMSVGSFLGSNHAFVTGTPQANETTTILYVARGYYDENGGASIHNCTMETTRLEAEIRCAQGACSVIRMRPSVLDKRPQN